MGFYADLVRGVKIDDDATYRNAPKIIILRFYARRKAAGGEKERERKRQQSCALLTQHPFAEIRIYFIK